MANYFNVSIEFLLGMEEKDNKNSLAYRLEKLNREKKELEMYQTMVDKGFSISSIASIFSVSEESIRKLLMKA